MSTGVPEQRQKVSGIVLAGGLSRRLGRDKAIESVGQNMLVERVVNKLSELVEETIVVVNNHYRASSLPLPTGCKTAVDIYRDKGSLGGIYTGLAASEANYGIIVACDMPFLNLELLKYMLSLRDGYDVVVPVRRGYFEPTHALYSKSCMPYIRTNLQLNNLKITGFYQQMRVREIAENEMTNLDPEHLSFFNVNTEADLAKAKRLDRDGTQ